MGQIAENILDKIKDREKYYETLVCSYESKLENLAKEYEAGDPVLEIERYRLSMARLVLKELKDLNN